MKRNKIQRWIYPLFFVLGLITGTFSYSQTYVTWDTVTGLPGTGTAGTVGVTVTATGAGNAFNYAAPTTYTANMPFGTGNCFETYGPNTNFPSQQLVYTFSAPVVVTRYNMGDTDLDPDLMAWNDSFNFVGTTFNNSTDTNCNATGGGVTTTTDLGDMAEFASWFCTGELTSFGLNYVGDGTLTHAFLSYSMEIIPVPTLTLCVDESHGFPLIGDEIAGSWSPSTISTTSPGTQVYTFTPSPGQPMLCPIPLHVTVIDCSETCPLTLTLTTANNMDNADPDAITLREAEQWISASNVIGFGNNAGLDGVVYHAGNFVELTPGFEAVYSSQFSAYPLGCSGTFDYRMSAPVSPPSGMPKISGTSLGNGPKMLKLLVDGNTLKVFTPNLTTTEVLIHALDGRRVFKSNTHKNMHAIDIGTFTQGVYLVTVQTAAGYTLTEKFIKK